MKVAIDTKTGRIITNMDPKLTALSKNFTLYELANNAGAPALPQYVISPESEAHVLALQTFRDILARPVEVNSGYRQAAYNKSIGGDKKSAHLIGAATDIKPPTGTTAPDIINAWSAAIFNSGIGQGAINIYEDYYHIESFTQDRYGYKEPFTVRVYTSDIDLLCYKSLFRFFGFGFMRCKK